MSDDLSNSPKPGPIVQRQESRTQEWYDERAGKMLRYFSRSEEFDDTWPSLDAKLRVLKASKVGDPPRDCRSEDLTDVRAFAMLQADFRDNPGDDVPRASSRTVEMNTQIPIAEIEELYAKARESE